MKNVTGYDLARLMCGAHGTLGVLTEVSLKTLPRPDTSKTLIYPDTSFASASLLFAKAMAAPFEVSGAARLPDGRSLIRVEGFAESVAYRTERLTTHLDQFGTPTVEPSASLWADVRNVRCFSGRTGDVWRLSIIPSDLAKVAEAVGGEILTDWAGGRLWVLTAPGTDVRMKMGSFSGHATLVRGAARPVFHPETEPLSRMAVALRKRFDPRSILNPGLMG